MDNYIIRIYRRDKTDRRVLVGTVEEVGSQNKQAFTGPDELWDLLNPIFHKHTGQRDGDDEHEAIRP